MAQPRGQDEQIVQIQILLARAVNRDSFAAKS